MTVSNATALSATAVDVSYGRFKVIKNVDIAVQKKEICALIGPNGAGKSTLLKALSGEAPVSGGKVLHRGTDITGWGPRQRRHHGVSRSFQTSRIIADMTVRDQLVLAAQAFSPQRYAPWGRFGKNKQLVEEADNLVDLLDLTAVSDSPAGVISYADQRKLEVALVLAGSPDILLLDEPTSGMSREESVAFADMIADVCAKRGLSMLLVEHDLDVVFRIADSVAVLNEGEIMIHGDSQAVISDAAVQKAYLGV